MKKEASVILAKCAQEDVYKRQDLASYKMP